MKHKRDMYNNGYVKTINFIHTVLKELLYRKKFVVKVATHLI